MTLYEQWWREREDTLSAGRFGRLVVETSVRYAQCVIHAVNGRAYVKPIAHAL